VGVISGDELRRSADGSACGVRGGPRTGPAALRLVDSKVSKTGVTTNTYQRAGDVDTGSFEFDEPSEAELERRRRLATAS
jgi:hypothetical protein